MSFKSIWKCMFSPRLNRIFPRSGSQSSETYSLNSLEKYGDNIVFTINTMCNIGLYASPIILLYLYRRNYFMGDGLLMLLKFSTSIGLIFAASLYVRAWGRTQQRQYLQFLDTLQMCQKEMTRANKRELQKYDFEFFAWPIEYRAEHKPIMTLSSINDNSLSNGYGSNIFLLPIKILAFIAIRSFGIRLIYPGSISMVQSLLATNLSQGRARLIQTFSGQRFKILTDDNNEIDTMFIDNRNVNKTAHNNGKLLFICSEGNAGFYEIGIMCSPLDAGYSVLGWNHPGFGGSTGQPYPSQEQYAIDAVMQFAINHLHFPPENIILYGWSIGGYTTCWAAAHYPNVKAVILDASFDDILPLAIEHMPKTIGPIVRLAIRNYVDLNNAYFLQHYSGDVLLVRRSEDEVICTEEQNVATNRGNFLLKKLLKYRYPFIFNEHQVDIALNEYLATTGTQQDLYVLKMDINEDLCETLLRSYILEQNINGDQITYPINIGETDMSVNMKIKFSLYLARKYFRDYKSTHCTPLPVEFLSQVWYFNVNS